MYTHSEGQATYERPQAQSQLVQSLTGSFFLNFTSFALISVFYGLSREYRYEVAAFTINWFALIGSGIALSIVFRSALIQTEGGKKAKFSTQSANL